MNKTQFIADISALVASLIPTIQDDYRCSDDPEDTTPGMQLTIGADSEGWSYQTGDNSFSGGAYGYATWGLGYIQRDSDPAQVANDILRDLEDNDSYNDGDDGSPIFEDEPTITCDRCQMLSINGIACHETGCSNMGSRWDGSTWIKQRECRVCGYTCDADAECCESDEG